jgi:3-hydroxyisobutyrate dehydrogenase-like beta-hydroxyacid dehydrogenase
MSRARALGVIGLGAMGGRIAARLLAHGHQVLVHDTSAEAMDRAVRLGAKPYDSPLAVAEQAPTVLLSLPTPEVVRTVATGSRGLIGGGAIRTCVDLSTTGPATAYEVAGALAGAEIDYVDAPVSGGVGGAESGTLTVMAAAGANAMEAVRPLLDELAGRVFHVGEQPGMGQLAKVLNNLLSATALSVTAEAVVLGVKRGLDAQTLLDVFNASSARNSATVQKFPDAVLPRSFDFGFALALMNKDVQLCLSEAARAQAPMPVGEAVGRAWADAESLSAADADCTEIVKLVEERTGARIGGPAGETR